MSKIENQPFQARWPMIVFLSYAHILAVVGISYIKVCKWQTIVWSLLLSFWSGIGVTGGAHRLWAHRSYKAHWTVRTFLMLMFSIANEGSIYHWARDHRVHHKNSETDADPHNVRNETYIFPYLKHNLRWKKLDVHMGYYLPIVNNVSISFLGKLYFFSIF